MSSREQSQRRTKEIKDKKNNPIGSTHKSGASLKPSFRETHWEKSKDKIKEWMTQN